MSLRPFLCHARTDRQRLEAFKAELSVAGADGWQDVSDLRLGRPSAGETRRVIAEDAAGFLWLGTPASAGSWFIRRVEIPAALARAAADAFPVVPVFADLRPRDLGAPRISWPRWRASLSRLAAHNGVLREEGEADELLWQRAAGAYVRHAVLARGADPMRVAISCASAPDRTKDIVLDWRGLVGAGRAMDEASPERARGALVNLRGAFQEAGVSRIAVSAHLFLPLAVLVGHEWGPITGLALEVEQRTGTRTSRVSVDLLAHESGVAIVRAPRRGVGPVLVVVSIPEPIDGAAERYAEHIDAQEVITLHAPALLDPAGIGGLARRTAAVLAELSDQGRDKHLLIRGPVSLAVLIGAAGNPIGRTTVPLWDQDAGYLPGIVLGDGVVSLQRDRLLVA